MGEESLEKRTEEVTLIKGNTKKYCDKYVAFADFNNRRIIAYGKDPGKVIEKARKKGVKEPIIVYVPNPNTTYIYNAA